MAWYSLCFMGTVEQTTERMPTPKTMLAAACIQNDFHCLRYVYYSKLKDKQSKPHRSTRLKSKFSIFLSWINRALNNPALSLHTRRFLVSFSGKGDRAIKWANVRGRSEQKMERSAPRGEQKGMGKGWGVKELRFISWPTQFSWSQFARTRSQSRSLRPFGN